jgi:hypothetical protein
MKVIRNERFPQRGLSPELLDMVENIVSTNKMFLERSGSDSNQAQINTILDRVIKPSMEIVNTFSPLLGLTAASSLLGTFNALDPLRYGFGSDGPKLEDQYVARSGRGSRSEQPLSSRSGGTRTGRLDRNFSGSIDCSGYVLQAIRSIAVDVMLKKGDSVESAVRKANANVKDINTPIMMSQARKDNIGGLSNTPSANEMRQAYREGRIEIGDALVVGPKRSGGPGHTGILALTSDGRLVVHESKSGRGVVERPLEDWAILGNARGGLKIFRHNYLKQLGIFDGKHLMKV